MNKQVRKLLVRLETSEKIPHVMRGILRNIRIDREEMCKACGGLKTSYTWTELRQLDPDNDYTWNWCTCNPDTIRWQEVSKDDYWDIYRAFEQFYGEYWTSFECRRWDNGYYNVYGIIEHAKTKRKVSLKVEKIGFKYKYYRVNGDGWAGIKFSTN